MTATVHEGLPFERYALDLEGESSTGCREMNKSPLHYKHWRDNDRPDRDTFRLGRCTHTAILEPHRFAEGYVVYPDRRQGKAWDAFKLEHEAQGKTILTTTQYEKAIAIARAVRAYPLAFELISEPGARFELVVTWRHLRTGLPMKARIDLLCSSIVELKTCQDPSEHAFANAIARYGYDLQGALYSAAARLLPGGPRPVRFIAAQSVEPFDVAVYRLSDRALLEGERKYEAALDQIAACRASGNWPGVAKGQEHEIDLPDWAVPNQDALTFGGEPLFEGDAA